MGRRRREGQTTRRHGVGVGGRAGDGGWVVVDGRREKGGEAKMFILHPYGWRREWWRNGCGRVFVGWLVVVMAVVVGRRGGVFTKDAHLIRTS